MTAKYIVVKELHLEGFDTMDMVAVVFPTYVAHSDMAYSMRVKACMVDNYSTFQISNLAHQSELALLAEMFDPMYGIFSPPAKTKGET